jgi:hypothetical protein
VEKDDPSARGGFGPYANDPERESEADRAGVKPSAEDLDDPQRGDTTPAQDDPEIEPQDDPETEPADED